VDGASLPIPLYSAWNTDDAEIANCVAMDLGTTAFLSWHDRTCTGELPFVCDADEPLAGCTSMRIGERNRLFCEVARSWDEAALACAAADGALARIDNDIDNQAIFEAADLLWPGESHWIGANDLLFEGAWAWQDGDLIDVF
jgi:hypothetical protein